MSRGKSTRLMATLPPLYRSDFEKALDKRRRAFRAYKSKVAEILSDQGGAEGMSHCEIFAVKKAAFDEVIIESGMINYFQDGTLNYGLHSQASFSLSGTVNKTLGGAKRKTRDADSLGDVMGWQSGKPA